MTTFEKVHSVLQQQQHKEYHHQQQPNKPRKVMTVIISCQSKWLLYSLKKKNGKKKEAEY